MSPDGTWDGMINELIYDVSKGLVNIKTTIIKNRCGWTDV